MAIFLIDYDGTCVPYLPEPGMCNVDTGAERVLKRISNAGHKLILWTCRNNSSDNPFNIREEETPLEEAVRWFRERHIPLDGVNGYKEERELVGKSRKLFGEFLIDDTSIGTPLVWGNIEYVAYDTGEIKTDYTYCVDWNRIEQILEEDKVI